MKTLALLCLALAFAPAGVAAQAQAADPVDLDAARREKSLSWYTSTPVAQAQQLANTFEQQTGVKVQLLRSGGQAVLRRLQQELSAGRPGADVLTMSDAGAANGLARQGILEPFRPDGFDKVVDGAKDREGRWIAQRLQLVGIPVRTDKVAEADRPRTWSDLADAKYKGQMVMPDPSFTAIQLVVVGMLSQHLGWDFYKALRRNDTMIVQGHQQVFSTMQQGERVIGAEGADPRSFFGGKEVPNQAIIYPADGTFIVSSPTAVLKGARSPQAAKLFAEFMVSPEAQKIIVASGIHSSRVDMPPPDGQPALGAVKFLPIDLDYIEDKGRELKVRFAEIFQ
ncbi:MAG TPA: extracellular solute-binding protein [Xanthobacteraceae bacterium]|nr:extracellular solute-binding protein [Xanthobacteraceae bacterium]